MGVCCDNEADFRVIQAAQATSPLVRQCQRALNVISSLHFIGQFWGSRHSGIRGNEIANQLTKVGCVHYFIGPEPSLRVWRQKHAEDK
jgi:hypothetical protein